MDDRRWDDAPQSDQRTDEHQFDASPLGLIATSVIEVQSAARPLATHLRAEDRLPGQQHNQAGQRDERGSANNIAHPPIRPLRAVAHALGYLRAGGPGFPYHRAAIRRVLSPRLCGERNSPRVARRRHRPDLFNRAAATAASINGTLARMMQWTRKRYSGKISRRSGRAQKRWVDGPSARASFSRSAALIVVRGSTVEVETPLMLHLLVAGYPPCFLRSQAWTILAGSIAASSTCTSAILPDLSIRYVTRREAS